MLVKKRACASTLALIQAVIVRKEIGKKAPLDLFPALSQKHSVALMRTEDNLHKSRYIRICVTKRKRQRGDPPQIIKDIPIVEWDVKRIEEELAKAFGR